jgi:hypothetical protein
MDITESRIYKEHQPRFSVQVVAAGLILVMGYVFFSIDFPMTKLIGVMLMFVGGVSMSSVLYTKLKTGKDVLVHLAEKKEKAKP